MKVSYYINKGRKKNLYCRISDGAERVSFSLGYTVDPKEWDERKEEGPTDDPYFYTLLSFKNYLERKFHSLKATGSAKTLNILKNEAESFIDGSGIRGIARKMFDDENISHGIPSFNQFVQAFEKFSNLKSNEYEIRALDSILEFITREGKEFIMDTYEGLTARLKDFINRRAYDEICIMTEQHIWEEIYVDAGIEKHVFLPVILQEWEILWDEKYNEIKKSIGKTDHLDKMKEASWKQFQVFMECYDSSGDAIELASNIDDMNLYPLAVIAMMQIFNPEVCYGEYCESEFNKVEWESVELSEDDESPFFYIKESDH